MLKHFSKASLRHTHDVLVQEDTTQATFPIISSDTEQPISQISESRRSIIGLDGDPVVLADSIHTLTLTGKNGEDLQLFLARLNDTTLIEHSLEQIESTVQNTLLLMDSGGDGEEFANSPLVIGFPAQNLIAELVEANSPQVA